MRTLTPNPIKEVRLRYGLSQRDIGRQAAMSPQAVMRYEQGVYENLSEKLANCISSIDSRPVGEVLQQYADCREDTQIAANLTTIPPLRIVKGFHPFWTFREDLMRSRGEHPSRMAFCILLAVHPATVAEYDQGKVKHMPSLIERALVNAGMDMSNLDTLKRFGEIWYERNEA